jgi:aspartyl-tRNA(Asn)/glutamyl-tRNA(Gln) amidotransferase subunit A
MVLQATELHWLTLSEAAAAFRAREVSPVELTRHLLERSERLQDQFFSFVTLTPEIALAQARSAEAAVLRGDAASPLLGIPMGYKDIYFTKGVRTTGGSRLHEDFVPDFDATTVALLRDAGAVMLGKTTTWEFAGGGSDITHSYFPSARNPWDRTRSPYGSSSGSGAALAAGLVAGALGTDTGGSIRFPAAACGVAGLKPTYGRCSRWGVFPAAWSLDHTGPMARSVEDCALMLNALAGYDPKDPASATEPVQDYTLTLKEPIAGLRVGLPSPDYFDGAGDEVVSALMTAVAVLRDLGAVITEVQLPDRSGGYLSPEGHAYYRPDLLDTPEMFGPNLAQRHLMGGAYFASEFIQVQRIRSIVKEQLRQVLLDVDVVVMPALAQPAETMEEASKYPVADRGCPSFARQFNQAGLPSLSLPDGFSRDGLPLSLMISGRPFDEATVLRTGYAYQSATDWHLRHPSL